MPSVPGRAGQGLCSICPCCISSWQRPHPPESGFTLLESTSLGFMQRWDEIIRESLGELGETGRSQEQSQDLSTFLFLCPE